MSGLNTAEALIALEGDSRLEPIWLPACKVMIEELASVERCSVRHAGWIALALDLFDETCPSPGARSGRDPARGAMAAQAPRATGYRSS